MTEGAYKKTVSIVATNNQPTYSKIFDTMWALQLLLKPSHGRRWSFNMHDMVLHQMLLKEVVVALCIRELEHDWLFIGLCVEHEHQWRDGLRWMDCQHSSSLSMLSTYQHQ